MNKVNYRSDFDFILRLKSCNGNDIGWPAFDWYAKFHTPNGKANAYTASCTGGRCVNCYNDDGRIHIVCDNHHMGLGRLLVEFTAFFPDSDYPDGNERVVAPFPLDIELVRDATCCPVTAEVEMQLPVIAIGGASEEKPLPFMFYDERGNFSSYPGMVYFDRGRGMFVDHQDIELQPGEDGYNELADDGKLRASTSHEFVCGKVIYRYTGREMSNLAIERNPNQRHVRHMPTVDAQPGLAFSDRGAIIAKLPGGVYSGRISLKGMYYKPEYSNELRPLNSLEIREICGTARMDGDDLVMESPDRIGHPVAYLCWVGYGHETPGRRALNTCIGVKYDSAGNKIFYEFKYQYPIQRPEPPDESAVKSILEIEDFDSFFKIRRREPLRRHVDIRIWRRNKHGFGEKREEEDGTMRHLHYKQVWRWRKIGFDPFHFYRRQCLVKARRRHNGVLSEWAYFHVNLRRGTVRQSKKIRE